MQNVTDQKPGSPAGRLLPWPAYAAAALLGAVLTLPRYDMIYGSNIDDSLHWAFNFFADGHYSLARFTCFPHGPLAFLLYPLMMGNNLGVTITVHLACAFAFTWLVLAARPLLTWRQLAGRTLLLLFLLCFCDLQLILVGITLVLAWMNRQHNSYRLLGFMTMAGVLALLIKTYAGLLCSIIITIETARMVLRARSMVPFFVATCSWLVLFFSARVLLFGSAEGSVDFLIAQVQLSLDNSEAVQFNEPQNWWLLSGALLCIAFFAVLSDRNNRATWLLTLPVIFAAWKHGMARSESIHMLGFFYLLLVVTGLFLLVFPPVRRRVLLPALLAPLFFLGNILVQDRHAVNQGKLVWRMPNFYYYTFRLDSIRNQKYNENRYYLRDQKLPERLRAMIGDSSADIYPWNYSLVAENALNWRPKPVLNSYAAYTTWLDRRDALFFRSERAPQFLVWEHSDPNSRGLQYESIDDRLLLNDEPNALLRIISRYEPAAAEGRFRVLRRRQQPAEISTQAIGGSVQIAFKEWIEVPPADSTAVIRAKISMTKNFIGALKSFFYKGQVFYIVYRLSSGEEIRHRIISKNARQGLWISPFVSLAGKRPVVRQIRIECSNPRMIKKSITLQFEAIRFSVNNRNTDPYLFLNGVIAPLQ